MDYKQRYGQAFLTAHIKKVVTRRSTAVARSVDESGAIKETHLNALKSVSIMAREIAHAINNSLAVSRGNLMLLRGEVAGAESQEMLGDVFRALDDLESLSDSLNAFVSPGVFGYEAVDVGMLLDGSAESLRDLAGREHALEIRIQPGMRKVSTSPRLLGIAIEAAVSNARQSLGAAGTIRISCSEAEGPVNSARRANARRMIKISISDSGPGFERQALRSAFDAGFSLRGRHHLGLGLWFVRQIALASGGSAQVKNRPGHRGANLVILLPCVRI